MTAKLTSQVDVLSDARSEAGGVCDRVGSELSELVQRFLSAPTEELANSIKLKMGTYAVADGAYRSACEACD